jgi:RNA polymerase sigma factor (sigma-70 family)
MDSSAVNQELSDVDIVARVRGGERSLYAELIRRYQSRLRTILSFYLHSPADVEEFLQASFVQAFLNLESCNLDGGFYPWLKGVALNTLKMELRRLATSRRKAADYIRFVRLQRVEHDGDGGAAEARASALAVCMEKLPAEDSALLRAKYGERVPIKTLTAQLQSTEGAIKVRLLRIRNALRACILKQLGPQKAGV